MNASQIFDPSYQHMKRSGWYPRNQVIDGHHQSDVFQGSVWNLYNRSDRLNLHEGRRPHWVAKAPGTSNSTVERWNLQELSEVKMRQHISSRQPFSSRQWDQRFVFAHVLDRNPTIRGDRRLFPSRPFSER